LRAEIEYLGAQAVVAGDAQKFASRVEELHPYVMRIRALVTTLDEMRARGIVVDISSTDSGRSIEQRIGSIRVRLKSITERYKENDGSILEPDADARVGFWQPLADLPGQLESTLRVAWSLHVKNTVNPLPAPIVDALASGSSGWADLQTTYKRVGEIENVTPTLALLEELEVLRADVIQSLDDLGADDIGAVQPFILAAQDERASLDMLTPEITTRLKEMKIIELFRIGIHSGNR
jgi:hypothetical protein